LNKTWLQNGAIHWLNTPHTWQMHVIHAQRSSSVTLEGFKGEYCLI